MKVSGGRWNGLGAMTVAALLAVGGAARADLAVTLTMEHDTLTRMEQAMAFLTVSNRGLQVIVIDPTKSEGSAQVDFRLKADGGRAVARKEMAPIEALGVIEPGESRRFLVNLSRYFDLSALGGYIVEADVAWQGLRFPTHPLHIDVRNALQLTSTTRMSPLKSGTMLEYRLSYMAREQSEFLFVEVSEKPEGLHYGVMNLGPVVRVFAPSLEANAAGVVTVVHQSGTKRYTRSVLEVTAQGLRLVDQSYESLQGSVRADGSWGLPPPAEAPKAP